MRPSVTGHSIKQSFSSSVILILHHYICIKFSSKRCTKQGVRTKPHRTKPHTDKTPQDKTHTDKTPQDKNPTGQNPTLTKPTGQNPTLTKPHLQPDKTPLDKTPLTTGQKPHFIHNVRMDST